jgi:hypothetical protein
MFFLKSSDHGNHDDENALVHFLHEQSTAIIIIVVGLIFRLAYTYLINKVGHSTKSVVAKKIMITLFITSYINNGLIYLLANSNLDYYWPFKCWNIA